MRKIFALFVLALLAMPAVEVMAQATGGLNEDQTTRNATSTATA
jgi:hypothetical protein